MQVTIPDELLRSADVQPDRVAFDLAIGLYVDQRLTLAQAARLAGMSRPAFLDELGQRQVPINYGKDDLDADFRAVERLLPKGPSRT